MSVDVVLPCLDQPRAPSGVLASLAAKHEYPAGRGQRFDRCVAGQRDRARRPDRAREAQWLRRRGAGLRNSPVDTVYADTGKRTLGALRIAGLGVALLREPSDVDIMTTAAGEGANKVLPARFADAVTSVFAAEEAL